MTTGKIDLHVHTTASDGTLSPWEVVRLAASIGLAAVAVTDHDTMAGVPEALEAGKAFQIEVIPGIEISTGYRGADIHVLGYGLDWNAPALTPVLEWVQKDRQRRNEKMMERMRADGVAVSMEELSARIPGASIGRPHLAQVLMQQGRASSVSDAFERYLSPGRPYYQPRTYIPMAEAVEVIRSCKGAAVLAHPLQYGYSSPGLRALVAYAAGVGVSGMEVYYTGYTAAQRRELLCLAAELGLFVTGGSDFHGENKPSIQLGKGHGQLSVPTACLESLKQHLSQ